LITTVVEEVVTTKHVGCKSVFKQFKQFILSAVDISDIPETIKHVKALQVADFSSNPIPRLPAGFVQLKNLTVLGLNDMSLSSLPLDFGR
jgi:protein scribble